MPGWKECGSHLRTGSDSIRRRFLTKTKHIPARTRRADPSRNSNIAQKPAAHPQGRFQDLPGPGLTSVCRRRSRRSRTGPDTCSAPPSAGAGSAGFPDQRGGACCGGQDQIQGQSRPGTEGSGGGSRGSPGGVDPDDVQVAEVDALLVLPVAAGAAFGPAVASGPSLGRRRLLRYRESAS